MRLKKPFLLLFIFLILLGFTTCGLEDYPYLWQLNRGNQTEGSASIYISDANDLYFATNYSIYYRIYLSNNLVQGTIDTGPLFSSISQRLIDDYNYLYTFENPSTSSIPNSSTFISRNYYELDTERERLSSLLSKSGGITLSIEFSSTEPASITVSNRPNPYIILRSNSDGFEPKPDDRYIFIDQNIDDLRNNELAGPTSLNNRDVYSSESSGISNYAYISMYIVAKGVDFATFQLVFSKPTHLGVFRLQPSE